MTVCLSFLADGNGRGTTNRYGWHKPTATNNHGLPARRGRKQLHMVSTSVEQFLKCREVGFEMAIYWYRVAEGHKFRRIFAHESYCIGFYLSGRRRKFGFNVHITLPDSFCAGAKTILDRASVHTDIYKRWFRPCFCKGDFTRDDSQRRLLVQHSVATLLRHCLEWLQYCSSIATLCCTKDRRCESSRVTSPERSETTPRRSLKWRVTYRGIGVHSLHTLPDSISCQLKEIRSYINIYIF